MSKIKFLIARIFTLDYKNLFLTAKKVHKKCGMNTAAAFFDIVKCGIKYQAGYLDYLFFEFYRLNDAQRASHITRGVNNYYVKLLNDPEYSKKLDNKVETLKLFGSLADRKWVYLNECDKRQFADFVAAVDKIVAKPLDASHGDGVKIFKSSEITDTDALYDELKKNGQLLCEEFVVQHDLMNKIYPDSVNTIRFVTILHNDKVHFVYIGLRVGNGKQVDNLNAGGMATVVDENGIIKCNAADKDGKVYEAHPKTGKKFKDYKLPMFEEAKAFVEKCARMIPQVGYVGWDIAIGKSGPVLIEANAYPGHDIYGLPQHLPDGYGIKKKFEEALK